MMLVICRIILLFLTALPITANAIESPVAQITNLDESFDLVPYIEYIEDADHSVTYEELNLGKFEERWQTNKEATFVGRNVQSRYWFRVKLNFADDLIGRESVLAAPVHIKILRLVSVWIPQIDDSPVLKGSSINQEKRRQVLTGSYAPDESKDIDDILLGFTFPITASNHTVIGWIDNSGWSYPALLPFTIQSTKTFYDTANYFRCIMIAFYAIMITQLIYNLCLFLSLREPIYGIYCLAVICGMFSCAVIDGTTHLFLPTDNPELNMRLWRINSMLVWTCNLAFIWMSLDRLHFSVWLRRAFTILMTVGTVAILFGIFLPPGAFTSGASAIFNNIMLIGGSLFVVLAPLAAIRNGKSIAGYLLAAELLMLIGTTTFMLTVKGLLDVNWITQWGLHWGYVGETLLLSLVLAVRTRLLQTSAITNLKKYELIFDDSIKGRFVNSLETESIKYNVAFLQLLGLKEGDHFRHQMEPLNERARSVLSQAVSGKKTFNNDEITWINGVSGETVWLSISSELQLNNKGHTIAVEGSVVDVTERKLVEAEQQKNSIIEAKAEAKSQFFASVNHELRTPLNVVLGYSEIALHPGITEEKKTNAIEAIARSSQHLLRLINDVLDLSKIEAQKIDIEILRVSVFDTVQDVDQFVRILAIRKDITFKVEFNFPLPETIQTDPTRLKQILINLCENAIKFTREGEVCLSVYGDPSNSTVSFVINDTGIGMRPEQVSKLFGPYFQAEGSTTRHYGGTGLGLHLSQQFAHLLGGEITVESEYGKGCTFTLAIHIDVADTPLWVDGLPDTRDNFPEAIPQLVGKVLYVEDNYQNQLLVTEFVKRTGISIEIADNGLEGIELARKNKYDLVFTDVNMPVMDGFEFSQKMTNLFPDVPIVAITANATSKGIDSVGFQEILAKPISSSTLYRVLSKYLAKQQDPKLLKHISELPGEGVLIVDDDENLRGILSSYLSPYVDNISVAEDGAKAISLIEQQQFKMVITDYYLPNIGGLEVVNAIRKIRENCETLIICITGATMAKDIKAIGSSGADLSLKKPIGLTVFLDSLHQLFEKRGKV